MKIYRKFTSTSCLNRVTALPSGVLQIYDAGPEDAGNYRCVAATIAHKRKSMEASLTIIPGTVLKWFSFVFSHLLGVLVVLSVFLLAVMTFCPSEF